MTKAAATPARKPRRINRSTVKLLSRCTQIADFEWEGHFTAAKTRTMMPSLRLNLGQTVLRRKREECSAFAFPAVALHINHGQTSDVTLPAI
jgi:hypothetical protein